MSRHSDENQDGIADYAQAHPLLDGEIVVAPPPPEVINGVVDDGSTPVPLREPGQPMRYRRDVRRDDAAAIDAESAHVREHLARVADTDDDPTTHAGNVLVMAYPHVDGDPDLLSIIGELDAEPRAHYLAEDYDPQADDDGTRFHRYSEAGRPGEPA